MGTPHWRCGLLHSFTFVLFLLTLLVAVDGDKKVGVKRTRFSDHVTEIIYFDDSEKVLALDSLTGVVHRSTDQGESWKEVEDLGKSEVVLIMMNRNDNDVAVAIGKTSKHWITKDKGDDWKLFEINGIPEFKRAPPLSFHSKDSKKVIMNVRMKDGSPASVVTKDGFDTKKVLKGKILCIWALENPEFQKENSSSFEDTILCVAEGKYSEDGHGERLVISNDYFKTESELALDGRRPVTGIVSLVAMKKFILAARRMDRTNEMALYVTTDADEWHRAHFGQHQVKEDGYTVMESTDYSLQIDVATGPPMQNPMGKLFTSNSLGYSFVEVAENTNRNEWAFVDFEQVTNVQGSVLINQVQNAREVLEYGNTKRLESKLSLNDGRNFTFLRTEDKEKLHLHSVTDPSNIGKVFSTTAPGFLMGVGNTGEYLRSYPEGDLWLSTNGGVTWKKGREGAHKYEFGDQGSILLAIYDEGETDKMVYSTDHGQNWETIEFKDYDFDETSVRALSLTTIPDSTSLKFILKATTGRDKDTKHWLYSIDFGKLDKKTCKKDDMEDWVARRPVGEKATCIMGRTQKFRRRKPDADCFVRQRFKDPRPEIVENCPCKELDYECKPGYYRSNNKKECIPLTPETPPSGVCNGDQSTYESDSGFRLIPGNTCKQDGGIKKDEKVQRPCDAAKDPGSKTGEISSTVRPFKETAYLERFYLERAAPAEGDDETVVFRTESRKVYKSHDHGKNWERIIDDEVLAIFPHRYLNDRVYFVTPSQKVYYSVDRAKSTHSFDAPAPPNTANLIVLKFHPLNPNWLIWTSCHEEQKGSCIPQAHLTTKNGDAWVPLLKAVRGCDFVWRDGTKQRNRDLIYCMQHAGEDITKPRLQLVSSKNKFDNQEVLFPNVVNFATMSEFIIVALKEKGTRNLIVDASLDGDKFADARLPQNVQVPAHAEAYTVLDSSTHAIFLHVTVHNVPSQEYGTIVKSNSNGTSYTMSLFNVNRNTKGFVDFEKLLGLEGVAVANTISNVEEVKGGRSKNLKTRITHNDGATWSLLPPPKKDAEGREYDCSGGLQKCSLHLHGYTERVDPRDTYSSPSAVGLMFGVGNVGEYLRPRIDSDTFFSNDGGVTWKCAKKGQYMWEFGDRGAVIVMVRERVATRVVYYSTDYGESWKEYVFGDEDYTIEDITTVPSDTSRNFLLWGKDNSMGMVTVNLDFSGLVSRACDTADPGTKKSDYNLFEPKHPNDNSGENCLFGHVAKYYRKKPMRACYNPLDFGDKLHKIEKNCTCTRRDFECDFNYERGKGGECKLVDGLTPKDPKEECKNPDKIEYWEVSGYRKIPISTCTGGKEMRFIGASKPCPGREKEWQEKRGMSSAGLFFAIVIPLAAAGGIGYWMWRNLDGKFGRIRLGDGPTIPGAQPRSSGNWVQYPVMVVSALVAVVMAVPMLLGAVWRSGREYVPGFRSSRSYGPVRPYTSRGSFARGRQDYARVGHSDESDLLGEDSDEDL